MNRMLSYSLFLILLLFQSSAFGVTRSCTAKYVLQVFPAERQYGGPIAQPEMFSFSAKGSCGRTVPNRCRERARSAALMCMEFHYNNDYMTTYSANNAPYYCSTYKSVYNYHIRQLATKIKQTACAAITGSPRGTYKAKVIARVYGKNKCAADQPLKRLGTETPEWVSFYCE